MKLIKTFLVSILTTMEITVKVTFTLWGATVTVSHLRRPSKKAGLSKVSIKKQQKVNKVQKYRCKIEHFMV